MSKSQNVKLDCGVNADTWTYRGDTFLRIDFDDVYSGYGDMNNPLILSALFKELSDKGYTLNGIQTKNGYYGDIDGMYLDAIKTKKK